VKLEGSPLKRVLTNSSRNDRNNAWLSHRYP
jgi:hypothetical protein